MSAREGGHAEVALPDLERRQANAIRFGTVYEVDHGAARVRVQSGNIITGWLPWHAGRAGEKKNRWDAPEVGEQVLVMSPGGDMRQGLVLPGVYRDAAPAPSADPDLDLTVYADTHTMRIEFESGALFEMTSEAAKFVFGGCTILLNHAGITVTGGDVVADGISLKMHVHGGVMPGPSVTTPPVGGGGGGGGSPGGGGGGGTP
jgi:phage baseplate assembly protein gpV